MTRPVLHTDRLLLEPLTVDHAELLVELDGDADVMRFLTGKASTRGTSLSFLPRRTRPEADARALGYWVGRDAVGTFLGWWCLALDDADPAAAELGYRLRRDAWGYGYATEGARALLTHAFDAVRLDRVWAETMAVNARSRSVMAKLGLRHISTEVRQWADPLPGAEQGEVRYELTRSEWRESDG